MQFTPDRAIQIIEGKKWQTRRPVHEGEQGLVPFYPYGMEKVCFHYVLRTNLVTRYEVNKTYAVQPGRGKPALFYMPGEFTLSGKSEIITPLRLSTSIDEAAAPVLQARIRLLEIWREDVANISLDDAIAEGFQDRAGFWYAWIMMYDRVGRRAIVRDNDWRTATLIARTPIVLRMAWALRFELVK